MGMGSLVVAMACGSGEAGREAMEFDNGKGENLGDEGCGSCMGPVLLFFFFLEAEDGECGDFACGVEGG